MKQINNQEIKSVQGGIAPVIAGVAGAATAVFGACYSYEAWKKEKAGKNDIKAQTESTRLDIAIKEAQLAALTAANQ